MKIKKGYVLRQIADSYLVIPVGSEANKRKGIIALNETAHRIWEELEQESTPEAVANKLKAEYELPVDVLYKNVTEFITLLREKELLE